MRCARFFALFSWPVTHFPVIGVVKKTFRYSNVFFYNPLSRNSVIRNIIMESGIKLKLDLFPISTGATEQRAQPANLKTRPAFFILIRQIPSAMQKKEGTSYSPPVKRKLINFIF